MTQQPRTPTTEAGRALLDHMPYWRNSAHRITDEVVADIFAIEAAARADLVAQIEQAVLAIRKREVRQGGEPGIDSTDAYIASRHR